MRHVVLINPAAGKTDRADVVARMAEAAFSNGADPWELRLTERPGHAAEIAAAVAAAGEKTILYVCGGDGTLGEAAHGLAGSACCAMAPVPIGSGNDFVRTFGEGARERFFSFEALRDGTTVQIDLLRVGERTCLNIASAGLDAAICARMPIYKRLPAVSGSAAYWLALIHGFFTAVKNRYAFEIDGVRTDPADCVFAVAANGRWYGGGFCAAPRADVADGRIDFVRIPSLSRMKMLSMIPAYRRGEHLDRYGFIEFMRCKSVRFLANGPIPMNLDGEIFPMRDPLVTVEPEALRLRLPVGLCLPHAGKSEFPEKRA